MTRKNKKKPMGNPNSKVNNEVQIVNIQEALARHEQTKQERMMIPPGSGQFDNVNLSQFSFHSDTFLAILMSGAAIAMTGYLVYSCLKRGTLCPKGVLDHYRERPDMRYKGRLRYKRGDEEAAVAPVMMYPNLFPNVGNIGNMAAAIEVPVVHNAPDQSRPQFSQNRQSTSVPDTFM